MRYVLALVALGVALCASAGAAGGSFAPPSGLRAFLLTPGEAPQQYYPRTPSFVWNPVAMHGGTYDFQLAMTKSFQSSSLLWDYAGLTIPAVSVDHQLPWMTGSPYALWARVRWVGPHGKTFSTWSKPFGFNMRWLDSDVPTQLPAPVGLVRWKPIEGATRYEVLFTDLHPAVSFQTTTNVADEREYFTLHDQFGWGASIHWRVRAVRYIEDASLKNGLPRASYGPWSPLFTTVNPPKTVAPTLVPTDTISDIWDQSGNSTPHELTPGFSWQATNPAVTTIARFGSPLYRVYIFTDNHCVNRVFTGSIVGSPAFAPRTQGGPFALPQNTKTLGEADGPPYLTKTGGPEGNAMDATGKTLTSNEMPGSQVGQAGNASSSASSSSSKGQDAAVDLWDSGWPSGRYYWTVVPVTVEQYGPPPDPTKPNESQPIAYQDLVVPQDQCEQGFEASFGKTSSPVVTSSTTPFVSGLAPNGRLVASAKRVPVLHDQPLIAWMPAVGATVYQVQISRTLYPWTKVFDQQTPATSMVLPLKKVNVGTWYYRVRGINPALPAGAQGMTWSKPVKIRISGDQFKLTK